MIVTSNTFAFKNLSPNGINFQNQKPVILTDVPMYTEISKCDRCTWKQKRMDILSANVWHAFSPGLPYHSRPPAL